MAVVNKIRAVQIRRDTSLNWDTVNPVLQAGEPGLDLNVNRLKVGDGVRAWRDLPFQRNGLFVEQFTADQALINRKSLTLQYAPIDPDEVIVEVQGAGPQFYNVDYVVGGLTLSWNSLGMDIVIGLNKIIRVLYTA